MCPLLPSSSAGASWSHPHPKWHPSQAVDISQACCSSLQGVARPGASRASPTHTRSAAAKPSNRPPAYWAGLRGSGDIPSPGLLCLSVLCNPEQLTHSLPWSSFLIYNVKAWGQQSRSMQLLRSRTLHKRTWPGDPRRPEAAQTPPCRWRSQVSGAAARARGSDAFLISRDLCFLGPVLTAASAQGALF